MRRRTWIKAGVAGGAVLALAGGGLGLARPAWRDGQLTPGGKELFAAVARAVLGDLLPQATSQPAARTDALEAHLVRLRETIAGMPLPVQDEIAELGALLLHPWGRRLFVGLTTDWPDATDVELHAAMQGLRLSSLALRQQAFHALRDLTNGAWFADPATWTAIGYPGPRTV